MSNRIYTIPAREVVPGLLWVVDSVPRPVTAVRLSADNRADIAWRSDKWGIDLTSTVQPDTELCIQLPGPSPRELLCDCWPGPDDRLFSDPWAQHPYDCPVHDLRLRLWPVGATWNSELECWSVPLPGHAVPQHIWPNLLAPMLEPLAANYEGMVSAFCEPEVRP